MDWILDHLQPVIAVIIIAVYILRGVKGRQRGGDDAAPPTREAPPPPAGQEKQAPDIADRTHRIQEEIRRRILERQRGVPGQARPVVLEQPEAPVLRPAHRALITPPPLPAAMEQTSAETAILERQRSLDAQIQALRAKRDSAYAIVRRAAPAAGMPGRPGMPGMPGAMPAGGVGLLELRRELTGAQALRKAFLLKEILGEPVGMRQISGMPDLSRR